MDDGETIRLKVETFHDIASNEAGGEIEVHLATPTTPNLQVRRLLSSRASSLLDRQQDEDEDTIEEPEPGLEIVTDDDDTSSSTGSRKHDPLLLMHRRKNKRHHHPEKRSPSAGRVDVKNKTLDAIEKQDSSFARLTEGMATYLCPAKLEDEVEIKRHHRRSGSETDSLQRLVSSGSCFNVRLCGDANDRWLTKVPQRTQIGVDSRQCTDLSLQDLRRVVANDISAVLGSTSGAADDWLSSLHSWLVSSRHGSGVGGGSHRVIRNRCGLGRQRSEKMKHLWFKWHSRTFNELYNIDGTSPKRLIRPAWAAAVKSFDDTHADEVATNQYHQEAGQEEGDVAELYYDSDPEVFRRSRYIHSNRTATMMRRYMQVGINTNASYGSTGEGSLPLTPRHMNGKMAPSFESQSTVSFDTHQQCHSDDTSDNSFREKRSKKAAGTVEFVKIDLQDDEMVKAFVKELTTGRVTLVRHFSSKKQPNGSVHSSSPISTPVSVQGWFEMGSRFRSKIVQPRFVWRDTYQPELSHRKLGMSCRIPESLDILSMVRILTPVSVDRSEYPFVKTDRAFTITTNAGVVYMFEATSTAQRDWFVHGLKLVVARLASMVIVGDGQMFAEFFSPWAHFSLPPPEDQQATHSATPSPPQRKSPRSIFVSTTDAEREQLWGGKKRRWKKSP